MYIYVYMYKYIYILNVYISIYLYLFISISISLALSLSLYIYIYICIYIVIVCDHEITHASYAICRDKIYIKFYDPFLWMGCNVPKARQSHYEQTVYFLPEIRTFMNYLNYMTRYLKNC